MITMVTTNFNGLLIVSFNLFYLCVFSIGQLVVCSSAGWNHPRYAGSLRLTIAVYQGFPSTEGSQHVLLITYH